MRRRAQALLWAIACLTPLALCGCAEVGDVEPGDAQALLASPVVRTLQQGDKIRLTVFGEEKLSGDYVVDTSGKVSVPLLGQLRAEGRDPGQLAQDMSALLRSAAYLDPKVTVDVLSLNPVYVLGEVQKPGDYPYHSGLTVLRVIALAGGQTYRASETTVLIQHAGEPKMRSYALRDNLPVSPGDLIKLPERYF